MNDLLRSLKIECEATGTAALLETKTLGEYSETVVKLPTGPQIVEQVTITFTLPDAGLLTPSARVLVLGESRAAGRGAVALEQLRGEDQTAVVDAIAVALHSGGQTLLIGVGAFTPDFPRLTIGDGKIVVSFELRRALTEPLELSLVVGQSADAHGLLESYGELLARGGARVGEVPTGWNSWDYYQNSMTMEDLRGELAAIKASPLAGRLRHFCIDMGWEESWGDWQPNRGFPGVAEMAREIRAAGLEPGIWISPLQARTTLPALRHNRQMLCRDGNDRPVITSGQVLLDPTHPWTRDWLFSLCRSLREAGFTLFKIDYLYRSYIDLMEQLHVPTGKAAAARLFFEIIREGIGEDAHLICCGAPLPVALGLADSNRVGTDIHNFWGHVRNCAVQIAQSYWLGGRVWINDPDFALIRCSETTDDPYLNVPYTPKPFTDPEAFWMAGEEAGLAELKTWLALVHLCGGSLFASDSIARLNDLGLGLLEKLLAEPSSPARPLDLFENTPPRVWLAEQRLGIFNFADQPAEITLPAGLPSKAVDFWTDEVVKLTETVTLPAHESLLLKL
ncbi:MAG: alpha-amylase family glycosyl hydrolase [Armatimonadota bacterium]